MNKYIEIMKFDLKTKFNFKFDYISNIFAYALHIFVLSFVWDYILQGKMIHGYSKSDFVWYIMIGEFIVYTSYQGYKRLSLMIKNGDIANLLTKPVSIFKYILAENLNVGINVIINGIVGVILGLILGGCLDLSFIQIILFSISLILGMLIWIMIQVFIALLTFFTEENKSFKFIISKLALILIFTPLEFYPNIIQFVFILLPTTHSVYTPAKIFVNFDLYHDLTMVLMQVGVLVLMTLVNYLLSEKGIRNINVNGG